MKFWESFPYVSSCATVSQSLVALRRLSSSSHMLEAGESWVLSQQSDLSDWNAEPWSADYTVGGAA